MTGITVLRAYQIERKQIEKVAGTKQIGEKQPKKKKKRHSQSTNTRPTEDAGRSFGPFDPAHRASNIQPMHLRKSGGFDTPVSRHVHFFNGVPIKGLRIG